MAYSTPLTAVSNATLTAAQWNASVRDNMLETPAAKATTAGRIFATTGAGTIAEREVKSGAIPTNQNTTSTSYTNLATTGPQVAVTTGVNAVCFMSARMSHGTNGGIGYISIAVSGATTVASNDNNGLSWQMGVTTNCSARMTSAAHFTSLNPGTNTFTMQYRSSVGTAVFEDRVLTVIAL